MVNTITVKVGKYASPINVSTCHSWSRKPHITQNTNKKNNEFENERGNKIFSENKKTTTERDKIGTNLETNHITKKTNNLYGCNFYLG